MAITNQDTTRQIYDKLYEVRPDIVDDSDNLTNFEKKGATIYDDDDDVLKYWNESQWVSITGSSSNPSNLVLVESLSDLPESVAGVITLQDDTIYQIIGTVDISTNRLITGSNTTIKGNSPSVDTLVSSTTGALITSNDNFRLIEVGFSANSGTIFDLNGSGSEICLCIGVRFFGNGGLGSVDQYDLFEINIGLFVGFTTGLTFTGANGSLILIDTEFFQVSGTPTSLDLDSATFGLVRLLGCSFTSVTGGTSLNIAPNGGNLDNNRIGSITACNFVGDGTNATGYSPLDEEWAVSLTNTGINPSDRLLPAGWQFVSDGETSPSTISVTTTPTKIQIDSLGGTSNNAYLPKSIRGTGSLWDATNDKITPITEGDAYDIRLQVGINSTSGGANALTLVLDIGSIPDGTGGANSIIIATDTKTVKGVGTPVIFSFPIFSLATFIANGGSFFLASNSGTVTISSRALTIVRTTSGAS